MVASSKYPYFIICANAEIPTSLLWIPTLIASIVSGGAAWGLVWLVDWTGTGFQAGSVTCPYSLSLNKFKPSISNISTEHESPLSMNNEEKVK
jgi:hypothetical protein